MVPQVLQSSPSEDGGKLGTINGLRGIAILMVMVHHLFIPYFPQLTGAPQGTVLEQLLGALVQGMARGVDVFFVLSGFVLYLPYARSKRFLTTGAQIKSFYRHRIHRLFPLYLFVVVVGMIFHAHNPLGSEKWFLEFISLITALFTFSPHGFFPPSNVVLWSVSVEIWFSALFPILVRFSERRGVAEVALITTLVCLLFAYMGNAIHINGVGKFLPFTNGLFGKTFEFTFGMFLAKNFVSPPRSRTDSLKATSLGATLALCGCLAAIWVHFIYQSALMIGPLDSLLFALSFATFLKFTLRSVTLIQGFLQLWPLQVLGCMCYSVYAWHGIILNTLIPPTSSIIQTFAEIPLFLVLTVMLAGLSYRYLEFGAVLNYRSLFLLAEREKEPAKIRESDA